MYGNNIPSVLTFSSQNNSRDNCNTQSHQYIFPDTDTDTKGGLGNTIAFVSITLSNKPFLQVDEGVKYEGSTSRARAQGGCMVILYPPVLNFS